MRVAIVDDGDWIRGMIVEKLTSRGVEVAASVSSSEALLAALASDEVDVAIIDMKMPASPASLGWAPGLGDGESDTYEGLRLATEVQRRWPHVGVLILTNFPDLFSARYVDEELCGGRGYWSKDAPSRDDEVLTVLRAIDDGQVSFEPRYREDLDRRKSTLIETLSTRERAILDLMREGILSAPAIAQRLGDIAAGTVKTHKENIYEKLALRARAGGSATSCGESADDRHGLAVKAVLMLERYLAGPGRNATKAP